MNEAYLAVDLGAESGRVIAIQLHGQQLSVHEIHRFANQPLLLPSGLHWDVCGLWREIVSGLSKSAEWSRQSGTPLVSVGVDAWGVDWALLGKSGELVGLPHAYRDDRNPAACNEALNIVSTAEIYAATGIQLMPINTIFSLFAQKKYGPELLAAADKLVFIPDLFHFWLSGRVAVESTIASTSQLRDINTGGWALELMRRLDLPTTLFSQTHPPGTILGTIRPELAKTTGLPTDLRVVLPPSHDTASAVVAVPATGDKSWCYLSSGTWSLLGAEIESKCTSSAAQQAMFTNELGMGGKIRFLKNIAGLWLIQELRRDLATRGQDMSYSDLTQFAEKSPPFGAVIDTTDPLLQVPGGIMDKISAYCVRTGQKTPTTPGEFARCCLESLAVAYRRTFDNLRRILSRDFEVVHIVGGGGQNQLLCQMAADAMERTVVVGPLEATAIGNGLVQAMAMSRIANIAQLRQLVAQSVELHTYRPTIDDRWNR